MISFNPQVVLRNKYQQFWQYYLILVVPADSHKPQLPQRYIVSWFVCPISHARQPKSLGILLPQFPGPPYLICPSVTTSARMKPPKKERIRKAATVGHLCQPGHPWISGTQATISDYVATKAMKETVLVWQSKIKDLRLYLPMFTTVSTWCEQADSSWKDL